MAGPGLQRRSFPVCHRALPEIAAKNAWRIVEILNLPFNPVQAFYRRFIFVRQGRF